MPGVVADVLGEPASLVTLLRARAQQQGRAAAFHFLSEEPDAACISYEELDLQARRLGGWLQSLGLAGERALLLFPPGLDYISAFFGCLYAGVVAVPAYPPRLNRSAERLQEVVRDSGASVALTPRSALAHAERCFFRTPELASLRWLAVDDCPPSQDSAWRDPGAGAADIAFLQYTSGSTTCPRGVVLTHRNLLYDLARIRECLDHSANSRGVIWLPPYHDMGLIGGILQPLYAGFPCLLMSPLTFIASPVRWLQAIQQFGGTTSGGPNFAFDLCVAKVTPEQRDALDLSSWDVAFTGAEPIRHATLQRFADYFAPCGFRARAYYPCYGLAEATVFVAGGHKLSPLPTLDVRQSELERHRVVAATAADADCHTLVSCGYSLPGQDIIIANPQNLRRASACEVGEIWVRGPGVAAGYWNRPEETAQTFQAFLADTGEGPFLRTGDLGFLNDGELFVTGRRKDLLILRGRNLYPQDLEAAVEGCHPALQPNGSVAVSVVEADEERLMILAEVSRRQDLDTDEVIGQIVRTIAGEFDVAATAVILVKRAGILRTSSGKKQRHACREAFLKEELDVVAQWHAPRTPPSAGMTRAQLLAAAPAERPALLLAALQAELAVRLGQDAARVDPDQPLTHLGLDSLTALEMKNRLESTFGVVIPVADFLRSASLKGLTARILAGLDATPAEVSPGLEQLVRQLQQLSDEEVRRALEQSSNVA